VGNNEKKQKTENPKIVIVIGAGANSDFRFKDEQASHDNIKMPTGEELVNLIADDSKLWDFFVYQILNEICSAINPKPEHERFIEKIYHFFYHNRSLDQYHNGVIAHYTESATRNTNTFSDDKNVLLFLLNQITNELRKSKERDAINFLKNKIKESKSFKPYYMLSALVKHYQPFSIDELLNSIQNGKIDVSQSVIDAEHQQEISNKEDLQKYREELVAAGKTLIALFLLQAENKRTFNNDVHCWYRHLRNLIITSGKNVEEIKEKIKNITIISFNYDRSLEYFLQNKLGNEEIYKTIKERIVYPYGSLTSDSENSREYGTFREAKTIEEKHKLFKKAVELGQNLRVIGELSSLEGHNLLKCEKNKNHRQHLEEIKTKVSDEHKKTIDDLLMIDEVMQPTKNSRFYFLGFGFHEENCDIIQLRKLVLKILQHELYQNHTIHYTNYGDSKKIEAILKANVFPKNNAEYKALNPFIPSSEKGVYDALMYDLELGFKET